MNGRSILTLTLTLSAGVIWLAMAGAAGAADVFLDDFAGDETRVRFVMEAENYSLRVIGHGADWLEVDGENNRFIEGPNAARVAPAAGKGARGNYMETTGREIGDIPPVGDFYHGPFLNYKVRVDTPGTYRLYVRWTARTGFTDSLYAFILKPDGELLHGAGPDYFMFHQFRRQWTWDNRGVKNTTRCAGAGFPATAAWKIPEAGEYTLCIAMRERASALDALVFQTDNVAPPTKLGPPQSLSVPENVKLSARDIAAINRIRSALAENIEAIKEIDAALKENQATFAALTKMLETGEYGDSNHEATVAARKEAQAAIESRLQSRKALENSIEALKQELHDSLKER